MERKLVETNKNSKSILLFLDWFEDSGGRCWSFRNSTHRRHRDVNKNFQPVKLGQLFVYFHFVVASDRCEYSSEAS